MNHVTALFLDVVNIVGGFLLGAALLADLPRVGAVLGRAAGAVARFGQVIGILALIAGGYYLIIHLVSGPHVFHFELVGIGVGVALLRDRLFPGAAGPARTTASATRPLAGPGDGSDLFHDPRTAPLAPSPSAAGPALTGAALLLAVFGLIAVLVGIQGLFTAD